MVGTKFSGRLALIFKYSLIELFTIQKMSNVDWNYILCFFENQCCYCGSKDSGDRGISLVADHIKPRSEGGDLVKGNVLPACHHCNDSRGKRDWQDFLIQRTDQMQKDVYDHKLKRILQYMEENPYSPSNPEMCLSKGELQEYKKIKMDGEKLIKRIRKMHKKVRERSVGNGFIRHQNS